MSTITVTPQLQAMKVPACLFGTAHATKAAWNAIARKVWKTGSWDEALDGISMIDVNELKGPLIVRQAGPVKKNDGEFLFMNWIQECSFATTQERRQRHQYLKMLVYDGMQYFWYALGTCGCSFTGLDFADVPEVYAANTRSYTAQAVKDIFLPWFRLFLSWAAEPQVVSKRLVTIRRVGSELFLLPAPIITMWHVAYGAKILPDLDFDAHRDFGELLHCLEKVRFITIREGKYTLNEQSLDNN